VSERDDPVLLAAAHALGSLTPEESEAYDAFLRESPDARGDAESFESVSAALRADRPDEAPPPALKSRLMAQIALTPQLPAEGPEEHAVAEHAVAERAVAEPATPRHLAPERTDFAMEPAAVAGQPPATTPAEERARTRWFARPAVILVAAAAAVALFVGGTAVGIAVGNGSGTSVTEQASAFAQISAAPDAERTTAKVTGGGSATLVFSHDLGKSAMVVDGAPPPPDGKTYQLWYIRGGDAISAGLMSHSKAADWQVLDGSMKAGDTVGLTVEPSGGSNKPTTKPVVLIKS
jgi:anti-sigma-K factor RskA